MNENIHNSISKINFFEEKNSFTLPKDYKNFLLSPNINFNSELKLNFTGVDNFENSTVIKQFFVIDAEPNVDLINNFDYYTKSSRIPKNVLPIAEDIAGNLICIDISNELNGKIYFWDHELELENEGFDNLALIASSFSDFLTNIHVN